MLQNFRSWLIAKHYSESTVKNYVTDIGRYLQTLDPEKSVTHSFSSQSLSNYLVQISSDINYPRYLASLNQFCQFGLDQQLITQNPLKNIRHQAVSEPKTDLNLLIGQFKQHLLAHKSSSSTIKNYINDVTQYINWLNSET